MMQRTEVPNVMPITNDMFKGSIACREADSGNGFVNNESAFVI